jgi:trigger factor
MKNFANVFLMQLTEKKKEALVRKYELVIPHDELKKRVNKYLVSIGTKIQGFRKVKDLESLSDVMIAARAANLRRIHAAHMPAVYKDVVKECVFSQIRDKKMPLPAYTPEMKFDASNVDESKDLKVEVDFEVYPEDINADISIDKATKYKVKISDDYVEKKLAEEAKNAVRYIDAPKTHVFSEDDLAIIDMFATYKDEENELLKDFEAHSKNLTPDFFSKLIGKKAGDTVKFDIKMPEDFSGNVHARKIAGKNVDYRIVVKSLKKKSNFNVDDEFAKAYKFDNLEKMREGFKNILQQNADQLAASILNNEISEKIIDTLKFDVPQKILDAQKDQLTKAENDKKSEDKSNAKDDESKDKKESKVKKSTKSSVNIDEEALKKARFAVFMSHYISEHIKVSDDEIRIAYLMTGKKGDYNSIKNALTDIRFREDMVKKVKKLDEKEVSAEELEKIAKAEK